MFNGKVAFLILGIILGIIIGSRLANKDSSNAGNSLRSTKQAANAATS